MTPFKRKKGDPSAPYWVKFKVNGQQFYRSTRTNDRRLAERRGKHMRALVIAGKFGEVDATKARGLKEHTFKDLFEVYDRAAVAIGSGTRRDNKRALLLLCGAVEDDSLAKLKDAEGAEGRLLGDIEAVAKRNAREAQSRRRSYNSRLKQARSVFARRYLPHYKHLNLPSLDALRGLMPVRCVVEPYVAPPAPVVRAVMDGLRELEWAHDPLAIVILLAGYAGLRRKEIIHARWAWLTEGGIRIAPDREFSVKGFAVRTVPLSPEIRSRLLSLQGSTDYMLPEAKKTNRENLVRRAWAWLRQHGITDRKQLHSLRKLFGSIIATSQGLYAAQRALGHASPDTTNRHYADLVEPIQPVGALLRQTS